MLLVDTGSSVPLPTDFIDAGATAPPPPTDIYDSAFQSTPQRAAYQLTPVFNPVNGSEAINPGPCQLLYVRVGATATTITIQVPGQQPYTGINRDSLVVSGVTNTERVFYLPSRILTDSTGVIVALYSQSTAVTSALIQVG